MAQAEGELGTPTDEYFPKYCSHPPLPQSGNDVVNHPSHYTQGSVECIDALVETQGKEAVMSFCICNAFKYLWRHRHKENETSIDKAFWYLKKYIELRDMTNENH